MNEKIHEISGYIQSIYMVEEDGKFFLLDGCCRPDVEVVKSYIENHLNRPFSDLKLVVATHAHPDHAGGLHLFKKRGIQTAGPEHLNYWYRGFSGLITYWVDLLLTNLVALNKGKKLQQISYPHLAEVDHVLKEGMTLPGFESWKVLETPGHTLIDLTLYHEESKLAYVADNLVGSSRNVFRPYPIHSPEAYKRSLQRYLDLGVEEFLMAHYGRVKVPRERIEKLINTTTSIPRKHTNTLPAILLKVLKAIIKKTRIKF